MATGSRNAGGGTAVAQARRPAHDDSAGEVEARAVDLSHDTAALGTITRAEIESQVATARKYPRSVTRFYDDAMAMATLAPEVAAGCVYALPRGGKTISGPSVRLAEIVACCWGNLRTATRIVEENERFLKAEAVCIDLERNNGVCIQVQRRITDRNNRRYGDDMINTTAAAASAIAFRNAVFRVVPSAFVQPVYRAALDTMAGKAGSFAESRQGWLEHWASQGVKAERVLRALGVDGPDDLTNRHLGLMQGLANAIEGGETTLAEAFPEWRQVEHQAPGESRADAMARRLRPQEPEDESQERTAGEDG
jgi:hypothetical protein